MPTGFFRWSKTPANNATSTYNWSEGMAPSAVNDSARGDKSDMAQWRDDIGGLLTTATSPTAYTLTSNSAYDNLTNLHGQLIAFTPHATNANTAGNDVTLALDGLTAKPIRAQPGVPLPGGSLILGTPYIVMYNNTDGAFYLHNMTNPYSVPIAGGLDYWGSTAPNSAFAFPIGQAISRTTYATLFSLVGTNFGTGDGSTTFNLPDKRGRVSAAADASAGRITGAVFTTLGAGGTGGTELTTIGQTNLPSVNFPVTATGTTTGSDVVKSSGSLTGVQPGAGAIGMQSGFASVGNDAVSVTGTAASGGSGTALSNVQPTIICNYIMRVL